MKSVKWVNSMMRPPTGRGSNNSSKDDEAIKVPPAKQKVIETEAEPAYVEVDSTSTDLNVHITAVFGYTQYECSTDTILFKDTCVLQTKVYK